MPIFSGAGGRERVVMIIEVHLRAFGTFWGLQNLGWTLVGSRSSGLHPHSREGREP